MSNYALAHYLTSYKLIEEEPKMITARDAHAIYKEAMLRKLWGESFAPKLDRMIREHAELGFNFVHLEYTTWKCMKSFIEELGYKVTHCQDDLFKLRVSWE